MDIEPTLGELERRLGSVHMDLKEDIRDLGMRLDSKVAADIFQLQVDALASRLKTMEEASRDNAVKAENRRWLVYIALIATVFNFVTQLFLASRGQL